MAAKRKKKLDKAVAKFLPESAGGDPLINEDQPFSEGGYSGSQDRRIANCESARELYTRLYLEGQLRSSSWSQVRNQIEGGRPFDPDQLQRAGESFRTNCNFNDARAAFKRASVPYWKMLNEVPRKISLKLHSQSPHASEWAGIMSECADLWFDEWTDYYMQFSGWADDYVMFGSGYVMWPDAETPRYKWAQAVQLMFPKRTKANVDEWELVCLKREITVDQLIAHVRDPETKRVSGEAGWNAGAIMKAIKLSQPGPNTTRYFDPNYWQDMMVCNDLIIGGVWAPVSVVDIWAKSRDGKSVRHYIFTEKSDVQEYLYEADEEAENFKQIFGPVFYGVGSNGLIHSIKGFGVMNYYYATAINRTKCRLLDSATFAMGMNFTQGDDTPEEAPPVQNYSMINVFPKGLEQLKISPNLDTAMALMTTLKQNQDENNFQYNEVKNSIAETDTATQAKLIAAVGSEMGTAMASITLSQVAWNHYTEIMRRLCKKGSGDPDAQKFQKRCRERGVPDAALFDTERTVKCGATPSSADPTQRLQTIIQAQQLLYNKPSANRRWLDEQLANDLFGAEGGKNALLPVGVDSDPAARRQAMMENVDLAQGIALPAAPEDAHVEHLDEHLKPLEAMVQATQQGQQISPDHLVAFQSSIPHIGQHMQYLQQDETKVQEYKQLNARAHAVMSVMQGVMARLSRAHARNQDQLANGKQADMGALQTAMRPPPA